MEKYQMEWRINYSYNKGVVAFAVNNTIKRKVAIEL